MPTSLSVEEFWSYFSLENHLTRTFLTPQSRLEKDLVFLQNIAENIYSIVCIDCIALIIMQRDLNAFWSYLSLNLACWEYVFHLTYGGV